MNDRHVTRLAVTGVALAIAGNAWAFDPLLAQRGVPANPSVSMIPGERPCEFGAVEQPLSLREAVERGLCHNRKTREAWANVKAQAAAVGVARAAFLPTVSGNWQGVRDDSATDVNGHPQLSSNTAATVRSESLSLNWVLFDFGGRAAAVRNASNLLAAARATQDATLQEEFATVAKEYYTAQATQAAREAATEVERMTLDSQVAAQARVDRGVAPITDALQAQTQHDEAVFNLTKAEGDAQTALGTLASDMGLDPDEPLIVPAATASSLPDQTYGESVAKLIDEIKRAHPAVLAAQAQFEAAQAKVVQTRAEGLPNVSLVAKYSRNNQPASLGLGIPTFPANGRDAYIGVQVTIPLFEGFGRHYQIRQAEAEAERQHDVVDGTQQQVALDVWTSYQALRTATQNVMHGETLLSIARRSFNAAEHRYRAGVGNILELLNTQTALATAKQRRVQALADWHNAKLQLASKLGRLNMVNVSENLMSELK
ncbi:outer membrane protein [Paraburkholderia terricola]|uniref:TolC family protein n=1 Tax=Paraburkholderia terricola TaxID=169427 RepID=UPI0028679F4B|nr:TolC family protein [Paraburkholderia terricola]MDR6450275.1 outer membrane protein [Paraburkholderia terricola]